MANKHKNKGRGAKTLIGGVVIVAVAVGLWLGKGFGFGIGIGGGGGDAKGEGFEQEARDAFQKVKKIGEEKGELIRQEAQTKFAEAKEEVMALKDKVIGKVADEPLEITINGDEYFVNGKPLSLKKAILLAAANPHGVRIILKPSAKSGVRGDLRSALRKAGIRKVMEIKERD